jgi:hypothetical protein
MVWGPDGETKTERRNVTKAELEAELAKHEWDTLRDFIEVIKAGDTLVYEAQSNRNSGYSRYVGTRPSGMTYVCLIHARMS